MPDDARENQFRLGFLMAVELPERGFVGGLLVTNHFGRPLEFQCTKPVKPNRTHEILYGPTLASFVLGELIGRTLIEKVEVKPDLVLAEQPEFLELLNHVAVPLAYLADNADAAPLATEHHPPLEREGFTGGLSDEPARGDNPVTIGRQRWKIHSAHAHGREVVEQKGRLVPRDADLCEPFQRVREALEETMRSGASG